MLQSKSELNQIKPLTNTSIGSLAFQIIQAHELEIFLTVPCFAFSAIFVYFLCNNRDIHRYPEKNNNNDQYVIKRRSNG